MFIDATALTALLTDKNDARELLRHSPDGRRYEGKSGLISVY
jgi:hypothetical protein